MYSLYSFFPPWKATLSVSVHRIRKLTLCEISCDNAISIVHVLPLLVFYFIFAAICFSFYLLSIMIQPMNSVFSVNCSRQIYFEIFQLYLSLIYEIGASKVVKINMCGGGRIDEVKDQGDGKCMSAFPHIVFLIILRQLSSSEVVLLTQKEVSNAVVQILLDLIHYVVGTYALSFCRVG